MTSVNEAFRGGTSNHVPCNTLLQESSCHLRRGKLLAVLQVNPVCDARILLAMNKYIHRSSIWVMTLHASAVQTDCQLLDFTRQENVYDNVSISLC